MKVHLYRPRVRGAFVIKTACGLDASGMVEKGTWDRKKVTCPTCKEHVEALDKHAEKKLRGS